MPNNSVSRRAVLGGAAIVGLLPSLTIEAVADGIRRVSIRKESLEPSHGKPRFMHTATALQDGTVLMAGGYHVNPARSRSILLPSTTVEIYDPSNGSWRVAASMRMARARHAAMLLPDGRVAVLGGFAASVLDSVEIYNPYTNSWSRGKSLPRPLCDFMACASGSLAVLSGGDLGIAALKHAIL